MVYRFRFRVWGGKAPGEYVCNLEEGAEFHLTCSFQPLREGQPGASFLLAVREGRTQLRFLRADLQWNGKPAPQEAVELHPGHLVGGSNEIVEILECPENAAPKGTERTRFLDLGALKKGAEPAPAPAVAPAIEQPAAASGSGPVLVDDFEAQFPFEEAGAAVESSAAIEFGAPAFLEEPIALESAPAEPAPAPSASFAPPPVPPAMPTGSAIRPIPQASAPLTPRIGSTTALTREFATAKAVIPEGIAFMRLLPEKGKEVVFNWQAAMAISACLAMLGGVRAYLLIHPTMPDRVPASVSRTVIMQTPEIPPPAPVAPASPAEIPAATAQAPAPALPSEAVDEVDPAPARPDATPLISPVNEARPVVSEAKSPEEKAKADEAKAAQMALFLTAIKEGDIASVRKAIEEDGLSQDFSVDELGRTPLVRAAAFGRLTLMKYLLEKKADINALDFSGNNALMWAAMNGHEKTARFLLEQGLDRRWKRDDGANALQLARKYRQKQIEKLLAAKAPAGQKAKDRSPASKKKAK